MNICSHCVTTLDIIRNSDKRVVFLPFHILVYMVKSFVDTFMIIHKQLYMMFIQNDDIFIFSILIMSGKSRNLLLAYKLCQYYQGIHH